MFDSEGKQTNYLEGVVKFLKDYQLSHQATTHFCNQLIELDLLEEVRATYTGPNAQPGVLTGFYAVKREKIKQLADEKLVQMVKSDALQLIYYHILSLSNFKSLAKRLPQDAAAIAGEETADSGEASTEADS